MTKFFLKWFLAVFFVLVLFKTGSFAAISQAEHDALMDLYNSTGGANWYNKTNWGGALGTENTWYGVVTDAGNTMVLGLSLYSNHLDGSLPSTLNNLVNLTYLELSGNSLEGYIPELSALTSLISLMLSWNQFSGCIPDLRALTSLQYLNLSFNLFIGENITNIRLPSNLIYLDLSWNAFIGDMPDLSPLTNLIYFDLGGFGNNLNPGPIPDWIMNSTTLMHLGLYHCNRNGTIPDLSVHLKNSLTYLDLSFNNFNTDIVPLWIFNLTNLQTLNLNGTNRTGDIAPEIENLTKLNYLSIGANLITSISSEIGNLPNLQHLDLSDNQISSIPSQIGRLTNLKELYIESNTIVGESPSFLLNLTNLVDGEGLDIRWNGLYTSDGSLITFLNQKQTGGDWQSTQTIAPTGVSAGGPTTNSITVSWTPVTYTANSGGYEVYYSTTSGGPYTYKGITSDKTTSSIVVDGLSPLKTYYFVVKTKTDSHPNNKNVLESEYSLEVSATTVSSCPTIVISPDTLPDGLVSSAYSQTITASGGTAPYTYTISSGALPTGLTLTSAGVISGTPTTKGGYTFTIVATDSKGCTGSKQYSLTIKVTPPVITDIKKMQNPFRLKIIGYNFHPGCVVKINAVVVQSAYKSSDKIIVKKGEVLKALLPKGQAVQITVENTDDGGVSDPKTFVR